jgi:hypothetical protein
LTDPRPDPDSDLTPAQDDAVRALLASARHTDPAPPDVVARLEATLASLRDERRAELETRAPVVTLASRRRRTAATFVLAAAAVVVAGVGITQVLPSGTGDDSAGSSAESATSGDDQLSTTDSGRAFGAEEAPEDSSGKQGDTDMRGQETAPAPTSGALADLSSLSSDAALKAQVRALRRGTAPSAYTADPTCSLPDVGAGRLVSVTFDGLPGAVVFRDPVGGTQLVDVFLCGDRAVQRSLRLRLRAP